MDCAFTGIRPQTLRQSVRCRHPPSERKALRCLGLIARSVACHYDGRAGALAMFFVAGWVVFIGGAVKPAQAQFVNPIPPPPPPVFNPSSPYAVPNARGVPVSPGLPSNLPNSEIGPNRSRLGGELPPAKSPCNLLSGRPCHPSFCSIFHLGPCFPQYLPPIGQDLRLTIVSTDDDDRATAPGSNANKSGDDSDKAAEERPVDSIAEMYAAVRACWTPPPQDIGRHGMEYTIRFAFRRDGKVIAPPRRTYSSHEAPDEVRDTYRDAVNAALKRCTPLHFSAGMAGAVAGRPIAIRFVDERTLASSIDTTKSVE